MNLHLVLYTNPVIHQPCLPIAQVSDELRELVSDMFVTMMEARGVGLAAPQVGKSLQLAVALLDSGQRALTLINPEIVSKGSAKEKAAEGCLSAPGSSVVVKRLLDIEVRYLDLDQVEHTERFTGWNARIIQHELDHLRGICIVDKLNPEVK